MTPACPSNHTVPTDTHVCTAVVTYSTPQAQDNCRVDTLMRTGGASSGSAFGLGTTSVSYWVNDTAANSGNCVFNVTVVDREAPRLSKWLCETVGWDCGVLL